MRILLSGYEESTQNLMFRVYAEPLADSGRRQNHKIAHVAALDMLSAALAEDFGVRHAVIRRKGLHKPQLVHRDLHMNLSHCRGLAAAAVGRIPLGIDAEAPRAVKESLLQKVCTAEECGAILSSDDKNRAFSRFWTLKEAYAKYTGEGISLDFSKLAFRISPEDGIRFLHPAADAVRFFQIDFDDMHVVSLCVPSGFQLRTAR